LVFLKERENGSIERCDFCDIVTSLSKDLLDGSRSEGSNELMTFKAGILYNMWNHAGISWDTVKDVFVEVVEYYDVDLLFHDAGWGNDPLMRELFDHYNMCIKNN
jgi:hypothetical protein